MQNKKQTMGDFANSQSRPFVLFTGIWLVNRLDSSKRKKIAENNYYKLRFIFDTVKNTVTILDHSQLIIRRFVMIFG